MSGAAGAAGYSGSNYGGRGGLPSGRNFEDRSVAKEQMVQNVRESSQQDRRVYVGNLSYDVKWHHLKDFMRQGEQGHVIGFSVVCWCRGVRLTRPIHDLQLEKFSTPTFYFFLMECRRWAPTCSISWQNFSLVSLFISVCLWSFLTECLG